MAQFHTRIPVDLAMAPHALTLPHQLALKDHQSFILTALVYDSRAEAPSEVMAGTVTGHALRPDGATVELIGEKGAALEQVTDARGNAWMATPCTVTVPQTALSIPGRLLLSIMLSEGETVNTTVLQASLTVNRTNSDQIVDGGEVIITIDTLIAQVNAASETATQAAEDAQSALAQATNIVSYAEQTGKTDAEKAQARSNIGAASEADIETAMAEHFPATGKLVAGISTTASANGAVATGVGTTASGRASHAEGQATTADGQVAHAEGYGTFASGDYSHAEGFGTKASGDHQHAFGKYNVEDANDTYLEIAGNGTADEARSNARTLDWNGNEALAGDLTVNKDGANEMAVGAELSSLKSAMLLEQDEIPDTVQSIVFDGSGNVQSITHKKRTDQSVTVRTDAFTFTGNLITEVRTLASGESLTIVTDTDTLVTTVTYAAA